MTKVILLPFALAFLGLVAVMVFMPRSKKIKTVTEEVARQTSTFPRWAMGVYVLLVIIPFGYSWFFSQSPFWNFFMSAYLLAVTALAVLALLWHIWLQLFAAGVPVAQELGKNLSPNQRRATWRRASRVFRNFRAS